MVDTGVAYQWCSRNTKALTGYQRYRNCLYKMMQEICRHDVASNKPTYILACPASLYQICIRSEVCSARWTRGRLTGLSLSCLSTCFLGLIPVLYMNEKPKSLLLLYAGGWMLLLYIGRWMVITSTQRNTSKRFKKTTTHMESLI